jgi:hypothetical protein
MPMPISAPSNPNSLTTCKLPEALLSYGKASDFSPDVCPTPSVVFTGYNSTSDYTPEGIFSLPPLPSRSTIQQTSYVEYGVALVLLLALAKIMQTACTSAAKALASFGETNHTPSSHAKPLGLQPIPMPKPTESYNLPANH